MTDRADTASGEFTLPQGQDWPVKPLDRGSCSMIIAFCDRHPDVRLKVRRVGVDISTGGDKEYDLRVGQSSTVQVKVGPDWLAVPFHEREFILTTDSIAVIAKDIHERAMVTAVTPSEHDYVEEYVRGRDDPPSLRESADANFARFRSLLERFLTRSHPVAMDGGVVFQVGSSDQSALIHAALQAGLPFSNFSNPFKVKKPPTFEGVCGPKIVIALTNIFNINGYRDLVARLAAEDGTGSRIGPYAILFDRLNNELIVFNRRVATANLLK